VRKTKIGKKKNGKKMRNGKKKNGENGVGANIFVIFLCSTLKKCFILFLRFICII
jgi:hypothetical protein